MKLSNPYYKINHEIINSWLPQIKKADFKHGMRHRVPFFMDESRYGLLKVKEEYGLETPIFFESGHEQAKKVFLDYQLQKEMAEIWRQKAKDDNNFCRNIVSELKDVVQMEKELIATIQQKEMSIQDAKKYILLRFEKMNAFFKFYMIWHAAEFLISDEEIKENWKGTQKDLKIFLESIYRPTEFPLSSREQRELLEISKLPDSKIEDRLKLHWQKYRFLSAHMIDDELFNFEYYENRVNQLKASTKEYNQTRQRLIDAEKEVKFANELLTKTQLPEEIKDRIDCVRNFIYLRTEAIEYMFGTNATYKVVFNSIARHFELKLDQVLHMTYKEIIDSLETQKLAIPRELIIERTEKGYAYLISGSNSFLVTGTEVDELTNMVTPEEDLQGIQEIKGEVAFAGQVTGTARVILDRRDADQLIEGEILVTTMTSPEYVPAMKRSIAIVTNEGGILCHAAIMSREFRKPCIIGTKNATDIIKTGQKIMVDAHNGIIRIL